MQARPRSTAMGERAYHCHKVGERILRILPLLLLLLSSMKWLTSFPTFARGRTGWMACYRGWRLRAVGWPGGWRQAASGGVRSAGRWRNGGRFTAQISPRKRGNLSITLASRSTTPTFEGYSYKLDLRSTTDYRSGPQQSPTPHEKCSHRPGSAARASRQAGFLHVEIAAVAIRAKRVTKDAQAAVRTP